MKKAYLYILATALLFSTMEVGCKVAGNGLDPFQLTFLRFAIGSLVLLPFALKQVKERQLKLGFKDIVELGGVGTLGIPISMVLFQIAVIDSNASTVSVLICVNPFFTMILAHFFANEPFTKFKAIVLLFALSGIFFMMRPWDIQAGNSMRGMIIMLIAAVFFGSYTVAGKSSAKRMGAMVQTCFSFIIGSLILLVIILIMGRPVLAGVSENIWVVLYTGVMVTGVGYYCLFKGIELSDATTGSFAFFLKPAFAPVFAMLLLGETILWNTIIGVILVLIASGINIWCQRKQK